MVANCHSPEHQVAILLRDGDQTEISCSSTNIADQDQITHFDALSPSITLALDPGIKRGLRFLEQCDTLQSGNLCGLECQFARLFIKGSRHAEEDLLLAERQFRILLGKPAVPYVAQVFKVAGRGLQWREFGHFTGRAPRSEERRVGKECRARWWT